MDTRAFLFIILAAMLCVAALFVNSYSQLEGVNDDFTYLVTKNGVNYEGMHRNGTISFTSTSLSTVVNDCIDAAWSTGYGGVVSLGVGNFTLDGTIILQKRISLLGSGIDQTYIELADDVNADMISYGQTSFGASFIRVGYMSLYGNKEEQSEGSAIHFYNDGSPVMDCNIREIFACNAKEYGFEFYSTWGIRLDDCISESNGNSGFYFHTATEDYYSKLYSAGNGNYGFEFVSCVRSSVLSARSDNNALGYNIAICDSMIFSNLVGYNATGTVIYYLRGNNASSFSNCLADGRNVVAYGFYLNNYTSTIPNTGLSFTGCQAYNAASYGIRIYAGNNYNQFTNGVFKNCATATLDSGTGNVITSVTVT